MAGSVPATAEDGSASVHSVRQDDVLQRTETGDASGRVAGLSRATGADENLRLAANAGKSRPLPGKC